MADSQQIFGFFINMKRIAPIYGCCILFQKISLKCLISHSLPGCAVGSNTQPYLTLLIQLSQLTRSLLLLSQNEVKYLKKFPWLEKSNKPDALLLFA